MAKIIVADDEIAIRQGLKNLVESYDLGLSCVGTARNGLEALELIREKRPDLALVDINMPHMNGLELIEQARELMPEGRIIIISGYDKFDFVRKALRLGVFDYLLKPINHGSLYVTLKEALNSMQEAKEAPKEQEPEEPEGIDAVMQEIGKRYSDPELRLSVLAEEFYMSPAVLSREIKNHTGKTFSNYLTELRMQKAIELMEQSKTIMIYTLAEQVGCSSQHYFCKLFKEYTGHTPSEYIRIRKKL